MFSGVGLYIAVCILISADTSTCLELVSEYKEAYQSTTRAIAEFRPTADKAVDGETNGNMKMNSCTHTVTGLPNPWWYVDLGSSTVVSKIVLYNRIECCEERLAGAVVRVGSNNVSPFDGNTQCGPDITRVLAKSGRNIELTCTPPIPGQYVSVYLLGVEPLSLCEVKIYKDDEEPTLVCPQHILVNNSIDQFEDPITWKEPIVTDNVYTGLSATCTPASGSVFDVGATIVTCSATDGTGNEGSCSFLVHVTSDDEEPTLVCPQHILVNNCVDQFEDPITWQEPIVADNVYTGLSATCTPASGSVFDVGSTIVTCSATDGTGNEGSCSFLIHVTSANTNIHIGNKADNSGYFIAVVLLGVMVLVLTSAFIVVCRYKSKYKDKTVEQPVYENTI